MDNLVTLAVVGTGQTPAKEIETGTPIDTLSAQLSTDLERKLLLAAGARAVYQQAGKLPVQAPTAPVAANPEKDHRPCSAAEIQILERVFQENNYRLVTESLRLLQKAHKLLPYELLPLALNIGHQSKDCRADMIPVLGERGRWLSQFNPNWSWVSQFLTDTSSELPADAETIWQEGTVGQRTEILRRLRAVDPAQARQWLNDVWKQEKAETRNEFLAIFGVKLSLEDEPLLENVLGDRSAAVRATAASLLTRLPESALAHRMRERANALLDYKNGELVIIFPEKVDEQWERDSLPSLKTKLKADILQRLMQLIPLTYWEERFATTPGKLIHAAKKLDWGANILEEWVLSASRFPNKNWIRALLHLLYQPNGNSGAYYPRMEHVCSLFSLLPQNEMEETMLKYLHQADTHQDSNLFQLLSALPELWTEEFSKACLLKLKEFASNAKSNTYTDYRTYALEIAAYAISPSCFEMALEPWELPENPKSYRNINFWHGEIEKFIQIVTTRKNMIEEIQ